MIDPWAIQRYDGRVARLRSPTTRDFVGYVLAEAWSAVETRPRTGREVIGLSLDAAFLKEGQWTYKDRVDSQDYDTAAELDTGQLEWYGHRYNLEWVDDKTEAAQIVDSIFGNKAT